ncbi:MAG: hypothetical protein ITF99_10125 [Chryseobacterium sp.]|nr:hypothetical protein [Chryseobacterium sp.]
MQSAQPIRHPGFNPFILLILYDLPASSILNGANIPVSLKAGSRNSRIRGRPEVGLLFPVVARRGSVTVGIQSCSKKEHREQKSGFVRMLFGSCSVNLR